MTSDNYSWGIYVLRASTDGPVRYVGVSNYPGDRFKQHCKDARKGSPSPVHRWLHRELASGGSPMFEVVERGDGIEAAGYAERKWIAHYRNLEVDEVGRTWVLNVGDGGEFLHDVNEFKRRLAYIPPNKGRAAERARMLKTRVVKLVDERGDASADGKTAWSCALRALTCARAAEWEGESGAEDDAVGLLLAAGYDARLVTRVRAAVKDDAVLKTIEGARTANGASVAERDYLTVTVPNHQPGQMLLPLGDEP